MEETNFLRTEYLRSAWTFKIEKPWNANEKISPRSLLVTEEPKRVWYALLLALLILIFAFFPVEVVVA